MKRLLLFLSLALLPLLAAAQDYTAPEVKVSTEKVRIGEKLFYVHKVQPRQTVFSICKAYGVTEEDLNAANPDLKNGLKADSILYIPVVENNDAKEEKVEKTDTASVSDGETDSSPGPREGPGRVIEHKVCLFESARSIARKYDISTDELLDYNGIRARDVTVGMVLLIPVKGTDDTETEEVTTEETDSENGENEETPMPPVRKVRWFSVSDPIRISLVLPFNAATKPSDTFLNFYCGALMAVQDQKEQGAHVVLNVFDLEQGADAILADSKFQESDLVIGPVEAATMDPFLRFSDEHGVAFVSPLDHKADSLADSHPFFFQVPASQQVQINNLVSNLHAGLHTPVILVQGSVSDSLILQQMEAALRRNDITYRKAVASELPNLVGPYGSPANPTRILIASENKIAAAEAINTLNTLAKKNLPMSVYCTNRVRNFETSDPDALFNISTHVSAPYFVDYSDPKDQQFVLQYRGLFSAEPDDFAFQGYDVLSYFIGAMTRLGTGFYDNADTLPKQLLHCNFQFERDDEKSGWRNRATRNIVYDHEDFAILLTK